MTDKAPKGQIWVCPACGKTSKDRFANGDISCWYWSVLCYEKKNDKGQYVAVTADAERYEETQDD